MTDLPSARNDLASARKSLGWSQARLAARLGVSQPELSKMESGEKPLNNQALTFIKENPRYHPTGVKPFAPERAKNTEIGISKPSKLNDLQKAILKVRPAETCRASVWEKWWFSVVNPVCVECKKTCKQSAMVRIISCPAREVEDE